MALFLISFSNGVIFHVFFSNLLVFKLIIIQTEEIRFASIFGMLWWLLVNDSSLCLFSLLLIKTPTLMLMDFASTITFMLKKTSSFKLLFGTFNLLDASCISRAVGTLFSSKSSSNPSSNSIVSWYVKSCVTLIPSMSAGSSYMYSTSYEFFLSILSLHYSFSSSLVKCICGYYCYVSIIIYLNNDI